MGFHGVKIRIIAFLFSLFWIVKKAKPKNLVANQSYILSSSETMTLGMILRFHDLSPFGGGPRGRDFPKGPMFQCVSFFRFNRRLSVSNSTTSIELYCSITQTIVLGTRITIVTREKYRSIMQIDIGTSRPVC